MPVFVLALTTASPLCLFDGYSTKELQAAAQRCTLSEVNSDKGRRESGHPSAKRQLLSRGSLIGCKANVRPDHNVSETADSGTFRFRALRIAARQDDDKFGKLARLGRHIDPTAMLLDNNFMGHRKTEH